MNFTRVSGFNQDRRVSFAPNAHVRYVHVAPLLEVYYANKLQA